MKKYNIKIQKDTQKNTEKIKENDRCLIVKERKSLSF